MNPSYSNLVRRVTRVARGVHRITEKIIDTFHGINDLIENGKKSFLKSSVCYDSVVYREMLPNTHSTPQPIITRRDAWLEPTFFYADHFEEFQNVIENLKDEAKAIEIL